MPNRKIVIIEDSKAVQKNLIKLIGSIDKLVPAGEAESVKEGLALIEKEKPEILLLDLELKDGNGLEIIKELRSSNMNIKIIILSNYSLLKDSKIIKKLKVDYFLDKTTEFDKTIEVLEKIINE
jgi:NarL family two-component system response regulator LiaR